MEGKPDPRARPALVALLVLSPLVLFGVHWALPHLPAWRELPLLRPGSECTSTAPAWKPLKPTQAASCGDSARSNIAALKQRLRRLPWRPWLTQAEARRGVTYAGSGAPLRRVAAKLLAGQPVSIATIGGSVTSLGGREPDGESHIARLFQYINSTFPHRQHKVFNKGMPAWGSDNFEPCLESIMPQDVDLVVVEFAVNDYAAANYSYASRVRRVYEQVLRRLLLSPSKPAVVLLQMFPWWRSPGDGVPDGLYYREPETEMTVLGQYYDLPVVSLRAAAWRLMHAGVRGFMVDKVTILQGQTSLGNTSHVLPLADAAEKDDYFYMDSMHPDPSKLCVLAELVIQPLATAVEEVAAGVAVEERQDARLQGLPPPMIPGVKDGSASVCYMLEEFKPLVKDARGFEYRPERPGAPNFVQQKWGWTGLQPGDWAELEVDTEQLRPKSRQHVVVYLMYLTSYQGMGTANVTCVSGCTCQPKQGVASWPMATSSVFQLVGLIATLHPQCRIHVEIVGQPQQGLQQKFMLSALMVAPLE